MTEQEKIEEMAQDMCGSKDSDICQNGCSRACGDWKYAERAYSAGYRKATEVIDEFVERLKKKQFNKDLFNDWAGATQVILAKDMEKIADEMRQEVEK